MSSSFMFICIFTISCRVVNHHKPYLNIFLIDLLASVTIFFISLWFSKDNNYFSEATLFSCALSLLASFPRLLCQSGTLSPLPSREFDSPSLAELRYTLFWTLWMLEVTNVSQPALRVMNILHHPYLNFGNLQPQMIWCKNVSILLVQMLQRELTDAGLVIWTSKKLGLVGLSSFDLSSCNCELQSLLFSSCFH